MSYHHTRFSQGVDADSRADHAERSLRSTQLLFVTRAFYEERIRGLYKTMTPEPWNETFESKLYKQPRAAEKDRRICFRFPVNCEPTGISGTYNSHYDGPRRRLVRGVRAVLRGTGIWI